MNFRTTTLFFGLLLSTLWVFGLMIAHKKTAVDPTAIVPTLADAKVDKVVIEHTPKGKDPVKLHFEQIGDRWFYKEGTQQVRVEGFRVNEMINGAKNARHDETADVSREMSYYGLDRPQLTVTFSGEHDKQKKEWTFYVGNLSADGSNYFVNSSDRKERAYAVSKRPIDPLFVGNVNNLRSKRLFDFIESNVKNFEIVKAEKKLELKKDKDNIWVFVEPKLGFASHVTSGDDDKMPEGKFHPKKEPKKEEASGVKALLGTIVKVNVENDTDFMPPGKPLTDYDLQDAKKAHMRIQIETTDAGKDVKETLLIGKKATDRKETFYYARLADDDGVFLLPAKTIDPIEKALAEPGKLRSLDIAVFDNKSIDYMILRKDKDEAKFYLEGPLWDMFIGKEKKKTNDPGVDKLRDHLVGKKAIVEFLDVPEADLKKKVAEWELEKPAVEVAIYKDAINKDKDKKDEKDKKDDKDKKEEPKKDDKDKMPELKKDPKLILKLEFGKIEKDLVHVRRTLENGTVSYFTVKKEFLDAIVPPGGLELAYLDPQLPTYRLDEGDEKASGIIVGMSVRRAGEKDALELERQTIDGQEVWYTKDASDPSGRKLAESKITSMLARRLGDLRVQKWVKKIDDKEDLDKFGLKAPAVVVTLRVTKKAEDLVTVIGTLGLGDQVSALAAICGVIARHQVPKGTETITIEFGKDITDEKSKEKSVYARHSGSNLLFEAAANLLKDIKDADFRDRASLMHTQGRLAAAQVGIIAGDPLGLMMFASPFFTGQVLQIDPDKVVDMKLTVRGRYETRSFHFERTGKDKEKTWTDKTPGLIDFQIDAEKVNQFVKDFAKLRADRVVLIGAARPEMKLDAKEATLKVELTTEDKKTVTVHVGASYQVHGYYASTSYWPDVLFMVPHATIVPILSGADYFAKERAGAN